MKMERLCCFSHPGLHYSRFINTYGSLFVVLLPACCNSTLYKHKACTNLSPSPKSTLHLLLQFQYDTREAEKMNSLRDMRSTYRQADAPMFVELKSK